MIHQIKCECKTGRGRFHDCKKCFDRGWYFSEVSLRRYYKQTALQSQFMARYSERNKKG